MKEIQREIGLEDALDRIGRSDSSDDEKAGAGKNYTKSQGERNKIKPEDPTFM